MFYVFILCCFRSDFCIFDKNGVMKRKQKEVIPDEVMKAAKEYLNLDRHFYVKYNGIHRDGNVYSICSDIDMEIGFPPVFLYKAGQVKCFDGFDGLNLLDNVEEF